MIREDHPGSFYFYIQYGRYFQMSYPEVDFLYLNEDDMVAAGVKDMSGCIEAMEEMFKLM